MNRPITAGARAAVRALSDYAVWPGLYAVGCLWLFAWLTGSPTDARAAAFVFLTSQDAYLLDRVKVRRSGLDSADRAANPGRYHAIAGRDTAVRGAALAELVAASAVGWTVWPGLAVVPVLAAVGVWWYAGRPATLGHPRPKDWPVTKAGLVAVGHTVLSAVAVGGTGLFGRTGSRAGWVWALACLSLGALVASDAVLCDLDDLAADRAFQTRTLPVQFGPTTAWAAAILTAALAVGVAVTLRPLGQGGLFAALMAVSLGIATRLHRRKDFIDARLLLIGAACLLSAR